MTLSEGFKDLIREYLNEVFYSTRIEMELLDGMEIEREIEESFSLDFVPLFEDLCETCGSESEFLRMLSEFVFDNAPKQVMQLFFRGLETDGMHVYYTLPDPRGWGLCLDNFPLEFRIPQALFEIEELRILDLTDEDGLLTIIIDASEIKLRAKNVVIDLPTMMTLPVLHNGRHLEHLEVNMQRIDSITQFPYGLVCPSNRFVFDLDQLPAFNGIINMMWQIRGKNIDIEAEFGPLVYTYTSEGQVLLTDLREAVA